MSVTDVVTGSATASVLGRMQQTSTSTRQTTGHSTQLIRHNQKLMMFVVISQTVMVLNDHCI